MLVAHSGPWAPRGRWVPWGMWTAASQWENIPSHTLNKGCSPTDQIPQKTLNEHNEFHEKWEPEKTTISRVFLFSYFSGSLSLRIAFILCFRSYVFWSFMDSVCSVRLGKFHGRAQNAMGKTSPKVQYGIQYFWRKFPQKYWMAFSTFGGKFPKSTEWHSVLSGQKYCARFMHLLRFHCKYQRYQRPPSQKYWTTFSTFAQYWIPFSTFR